MSAAQTLPREELLRAGSAIVGCPPLALTKWRGHSNRIYVAGIYLPKDLDPADLIDAVVIAVRRDGTGNSNGLAQPVRVTLCPDVVTARAFLAVLPKAVTELHLHRTEPSATERARIVADLQPE
ncbi:hypothetical protein [uncultured Variovorax sp.]|uniref:hypothetical protein n=1 Tax=uncultured Variovorax sp. TaxID=114708 RepID=UPI00260B6B91|nr:hypothetical protein [uncultured Variovorax sp.]